MIFQNVVNKTWVTRQSGAKETNKIWRMVWRRSNAVKVAFDQNDKLFKKKLEQEFDIS